MHDKRGMSHRPGILGAVTRTGDAIDEIERAVARFMRTHHGLITLAQALLLGFTYAMVRTRLDSGAWRLVGPGVYCSASAPHTEHQRLLAAVWSPAVEGLASHRSAAWLWGLLSTAPDA